MGYFEPIKPVKLSSPVKVGFPPCSEEFILPFLEKLKWFSLL